MTQRDGQVPTESRHGAEIQAVTGSDSQNRENAAPYTSFSKHQKSFLTYMLGFLCLISSLSATIYFPLIPLLASQYDTSIQAINLTITLYLVFQGLAPSFWSPISDTLGRRPVYLATFGVYAASSLGLALSGRSYVVLTVLRAFQSIGGAAILSIAYGAVADVATHAERGSMLGPMLASGNLGPCLGPVVGGSAIYATGQPAWCFWVLTILGSAAFLLIGWTFPETNRTVVGNGSVRAAGVWRTWWVVLTASRRGHSSSNLDVPHNDIGEFSEKERVGKGAHRGGTPGDHKRNQASPTGRGRLTIPNPFASLRLIFFWDTSLVLFLAGSPYCAWYLIQTSIPTIYGKEDAGYGFSDLAVGLCYLAGGSGVIAGGFIAGRLMDWNYDVVARKAGLPVDRKAGDNVHSFPIEHARSRGSIFILAVSVGAVVGLGWAAQSKVHPAVPLILQCLIGAKCTVLHQVYSALLVDIFPEKPSTAAASNNIIRCGLSTAAVAAMQPLLGALGKAWFFTLVALLDGGLSIFGVLVLRRWGKGWRDRRRISWS